MIARKLSGSLKDEKIENLSKSIKEISNIIDAYNLANKLSNDKSEKYKKVKQSFGTMEVQGEKVETILGQNYRVNLFEDGSIEFNFVKDVYGHSNAVQIEDQINSFPFESKTSINSMGFGQFVVRSNMKLGKKVEFEMVMDLISKLEFK